MKNILLNTLTAALLFLMPNASFGQAPTLGTARDFVLFTTNGAMTNSGIPHLTHLTGNVGSNLPGSVSGFGNVDGQMHTADGSAAAATAAVISLYGQLNSATTTISPSTTILGNGTTLFPGVYQYPLLTACSMNLDLFLDALGDPNAIFIIKIDGAFSPNTASKVKLVNGALACNVFWKVEGMVNMASGVSMKGTIVAHNSAINMSTLDTLEGRALSMNGSVTVAGIMAYMPIGCGSAVLTGPAAPALASTGAYGVFSSIGAVTSTPVTYVFGDVGSNSTTSTGFVLSNVTGTIHTPPDASTAACAADLTNVYNYLVALPADIDLLDPSNLGYDLVLTPHSYQITAPTPISLTGSIYLNAQNNPNAVFVLKMNGAFVTSTLSKIVLINGAQAKNVYWKADGAVHIYDNSVFNGTIVGAGAITINNADTLRGRALTINGAVAINGSYISTTPTPCFAPAIGGSLALCTGSASILTNDSVGGTWTSSNPTVAKIDTFSGVLAGMSPGTATINYFTATGCSSTAIATVNPSPSAIAGPDSVCSGSSITLTDVTTGGTWSSSNPLVATVGSGSGIVTGLAQGTSVITYATPGSCVATKLMSVNIFPVAGVITGPSAVCTGSSITLVDIAPGGVWSSSNATANVIGGTVTGIAAGVDTIIYTVSNACGITATSKSVTVNAMPGAGTITGPSSVCVGSSIVLVDGVSGGVWSSSNASATVIGGTVTGMITGIDTIKYSVTSSGCTASATKSVTINGLPGAGIVTGPSNVCVGSSITLVDIVSGGTWSSSNTSQATVGSTGMVTGVAAGNPVISYTVTNGCGNSYATKAITVNPLPNPGIITGPSNVCIGSSITLSESVSGGIWSASNTNATVLGGVVTGVIAGTDVISYAVTNSCGTDFAQMTITINALPVSGSIVGAASVCVGSSVILTNLTTGGVWSSTNSSIATSLSGTITGVSAGVDTIKYSVTNLCGTAVSRKVITVNSLPSIPLIATQSPTAVCLGAMYQNFIAAILPPTSIAYNWTAINATVWAQGTTGQYALINFPTAGNALVTLQAINIITGCTSKSTNTVVVSGGPSQTPVVSYFNRHFVCTPNNENSYQWGYDNMLTLDSTVLNGEINQDYLNASPDFANKLYWVMTTMGGCMQKTYYRAALGVQNANNDAVGITVYPNPATAVVNVAISQNVRGNIKIDVQNMLGQKVSTMIANDNKAVIDISNLPVGSYIITCYNDGTKIAAARFNKN